MIDLFSEDDHPLTEAEKTRAGKVQKKLEAYEEKGYSAVEMTIGVKEANLYAIVICLPFIAVFTALWFIFNKISFDVESFDLTISLLKPFLLMIATLVAIVIHELIHAFFWGIANPEHFKAIEFGIIWKMLTPYCSCMEPVTKAQYLIALLAPGFFLGVVPCVISIFTGGFYLFLFGIVMILGAGGDLQVAWKLLRFKSEKKENLCLDHPAKVGLLILEK